MTSISAIRGLSLAGLLLIGISAPSDLRAATPAQAELEYGDAWADLGNWKRALTHYKKALKLDPKQAQARIRLAQGLHATGRSKAALAMLAALAPDQAAQTKASLTAGRIQLDLGKLPEACQNFERVLSAQADQPAALFGAGVCHARRYQKAKGVEHRRAAEGHLRAYLEKNPDGAYALRARETLDQLELGEAGVLISRAKVAFADDRIEQAEKLARQAIAKSPGLAEAHYLLGVVLASPKIDRLAEARASWAKAKDHPQALMRLGVASLEEDDLERARTLLERAVAKAPNLPEAHYHLGLVYLELNALQEQGRQDLRKRAVAAFTRVGQLAPNTPLGERAASKVRMLRGELLYLTERDVLDTASEVELGRRLTARLEDRFGLVSNKKLERRLTAILRRLTAHSDRLGTGLPYRVKILKVDGINALSLTGGTIYLYQGLVDFVREQLGDTDDAYAVLIGHELVHLDRRHGLDMLDLVGGGQQLMAGKSLNVRSLNHLMKGVGRKHEFEADLIGCLYAYRAGYDPAVAYRFHRKMIATGHEVPEGLDHPTHTERAGRLKEYLLGLRARARHFDLGVRELKRDNYDLAIRHLELFLGLFPRDLAARNDLALAMHHRALQIGEQAPGYKLSTDIDPNKRIPAIRLRSAGQRKAFDPDRAMMQEAVELFQDIALRDPTYLPAQVNLGASLVALGRQGEAVKVFEQVLEADPDAVAAKVNLAVVKLSMGFRDKAVEALRAIVKKHPDCKDAHYNLARALAELGREDEAREHLQAYLAKDQHSGWARLARAQLEGLDAAGSPKPE